MKFKHTNGIGRTTLKYMENRKGLEEYNKISYKLGTIDFEQYDEEGLIIDMEHR